MVKVRNPLLSGDVRGAFGKKIIFTRGGQARRYFKPRNPNSAAQQAQREAFKEFSVPGLTQEQADLLYSAILHLHDDTYSPLGHGHNHGALTGLGDDDHTQYYNQTRGDLRYSPLGHLHQLSEVSDLALFSATLSAYGGAMIWNSTTGYAIQPGRAVVNGVVLSWNNAVARVSLTLANSTLYYVYLYSNSGSAALEESVTLPVWNNGLNCFIKTGDVSRMCIGFITTNSTGGIRKFLNSVLGRVSEFLYTDGVDIGSTKRPVNQQVGSSWTSFSLVPLVPAHATHVYLLPKIHFQNIGDDGTLGLSPVSLGSSVAAESPFSVRFRGVAVGATNFVGTTWMAIEQSQTYFYRLQVTAGAPLASVEIQGARVLR